VPDPLGRAALSRGVRRADSPGMAVAAQTSRRLARLLQILLGVLVAVPAFAVSSTFLSLSVAAISHQRLPSDLITPWLGSAAVGTLLWVFSWRLVTSRGSRAGGGLLSPSLYSLLGTAFASLAVWIAWSLPAKSPMGSVLLLAIVGWPAPLCFVAARRRCRKPRSRAA
jgi:hypothetical protein